MTIKTLRQTLLDARTAQTSAFVPFIMAGDPDMKTTIGILHALQKSGAAAIELGVPFSDPVADGVTVQQAAERALAAGATLAGVFNMLKQARSEGLSIPVCLFSYLNPVFHMGYDAFARAAQDAGAQGALIVDAHQQTSTPGLYALGDVVAGLKQIGVAIGQAAQAATAVHNSLESNPWGGSN